MKKLLVIPLVILGIMIIFFLSVPLFLVKKGIFLSPGEDCSDDGIKNTWDSIFKINSDGITIISNSTKCAYIAYKISGTTTYVLTGLKSILDEESPFIDFLLYSNLTFISAQKRNTTLWISSFLTSRSSKNYENLTEDIIYLEENIEGDKSLPQRNMKLDTAKGNSTLIFQANFENWTTIQDAGGTIYLNLDTKESKNSIEANIVKIFANLTKEQFIYFNLIKSPFEECTPNWTQKNLTLKNQEKVIFYYTDKNNCSISANRPANITSYIDLNNNRLIGNFTSLNSSINLKFYINDKLANLSTKQNKTKTIKIKEGNITRVRFDWDFDNELLNIQNITIKKQSNNSFGYLIVNGIEEEKILEIDRLKAGNYVCIKDNIIKSISEITPKCNKSSEYLVPCPGNKSRFSCNISSGKFIVSGLFHSAVREFTGAVTSSCISYWNCTNWTICLNNIQRRICIDENNCNTNLGKPPESRNCTSACTPDWNCTGWVPETCPKNETQIRMCLDENNCNTNLGKPPETNSCTYKSSSLLAIIIIIFAVLIIIAIILIFLLKKSKQPKTSFIPSSSYYSSPPTAPPKPAYPPQAPSLPKPPSYSPQAPFQPQKPLYPNFPNQRIISPSQATQSF